MKGSPTLPHHPATLPPRPSTFDTRAATAIDHPVVYRCPLLGAEHEHEHEHEHDPHPHHRTCSSMPPRPRFEYNPLSYAYPDDESDKELFLQASGRIASRLRTPVLLYWVNQVFSDGEEVWQVVRLDRREDDGARHTYVYPDLLVVDGGRGEARVSLGVLSRDQREELLECAEEIEYDARGGGEGECVRWMGRLLERMVAEGLVAQTAVDATWDPVDGCGRATGIEAR